MRKNFIRARLIFTFKFSSSSHNTGRTSLHYPPPNHTHFSLNPYVTSQMKNLRISPEKKKLNWSFTQNQFLAVPRRRRFSFSMNNFQFSFSIQFESSSTRSALWDYFFWYYWAHLIFCLIHRGRDKRCNREWFSQTVFRIFWTRLLYPENVEPRENEMRQSRARAAVWVCAWVGEGTFALRFWQSCSYDLNLKFRFGRWFEIFVRWNWWNLDSKFCNF